MIDFLPTLASLSTQVTAALQAMPHDTEEASQRLLAVQAELDRLTRQGQDEAATMAQSYGEAA